MSDTEPTAPDTDPDPATTYPRVMSSGGASDDLWVYPSVYTVEYDTKEEAQAAIDLAREEGRYVGLMDPETGAYMVETGGGWSVAIETDPSTRYSTSDHTDGK